MNLFVTKGGVEFFFGLVSLSARLMIPNVFVGDAVFVMLHG